jgi:hypothetical protein
MPQIYCTLQCHNLGYTVQSVLVENANSVFQKTTGRNFSHVAFPVESLTPLRGTHVTDEIIILKLISVDYDRVYCI